METRKDIKTVLATLVVGVVAFAMVLTPSFAQAQSSQADVDRLVQIIELMTAQLNQSGGTNVSLPADLSTLTTTVPTGSVLGANTGSACPYVWNRNMGVGASGADVQQLQRFLNQQGITVATVGAGAPGFESTYYGPRTANAVARFQMQHAAEILAPLRLVQPTDYFGSLSRSVANQLRAGGGTSFDIDFDDDVVFFDDDDDRDDDRRDRDLDGDEAEVDRFEIDDAADDDIEEGREDEEVAEIEVEFEESDVLLHRLDLDFELAGGQLEAEDEPWDVFEEITIWLDGDKIGSKQADDEDDWQSDERTIRISDLDDTIIREGDRETLIVAVTTQNGLDLESDDTADWRVSLPNEALRVEDATGDIVRFDPTDSGPATFTIGEEGVDDELRVRSSSDDPDSTTFELEDDDRSDFETIFAFDLDTEDSENDIEVKEIRVDVDATSDGTTPLSTSFLIDDAQLEIDGEEFDDVTITHGTTGQFVFDLSDEDFFIDAGDRVTVEFQVQFDALNPAYEGATVEASTDADVGYDAEGADDLGSSQLEGAASGDEHTLRTTGSTIEFDDEDFDFQENSDSTASDDEGVFTIRFEVTAFEQDLYLNKVATRGTGSNTAGAEYLITSGGSTIVTGSTVSSFSSSADTQNGRFVVPEGETEEFTLKVEFNPDSQGFYALVLNNINFTDTSSGSVFTGQTALPRSDFETDEYSI